MNKHEPADPVFRALPDHGVIVLEGRDALAFAQAQCMNDVAALVDSQWQWNGWLTPKGRVIALFALLRRDAESFWMVLPDGDAQYLASLLQRFVFRSKVRIGVRDDLSVTGAFSGSISASASSAVMADGDSLELDFSAEGGARALRISHPTEGSQPGPDADHIARWKAFDLAHGLPRLSDAQREHWTPQQLSLDRLQAYSVRKGCYPGQEIVARTHFLGGAAKRGLVPLSLASPAAVGDEVMHADRAIGQLITVVSRPGSTVALAVLPLERDGTPLHVAGQTAVVETLRGGLAR